MRICLYTHTALPEMGGQELVVDALARQFMACGHEAVVLAPWPRGRWRLGDKSLPYPVRRHPSFYSTRRFVDWYRWWLARAHRRYCFDVVHCHSVYPDGYIAARCASVADLPVVMTSHGGDVTPSCPVLRKPGLPGRYLVALNRADAVVAISRFTEERMRQLCPGLRRVERIPNGVDAARFAAAVQRPAGLDPAIRAGEYLLFLGRLDRRKGVDVLLEAFSTAGAGNDVCLVIAGAGRERSALENRAAGLGIDGRVRFFGRAQGTAKTWLLQNALCTVMPTRTWEAFPLVLLESYASGTPVIGTRVPGLDELIEPGRTGILVPPESAPELAEAVGRVVADREATDRLSHQARRVAQDYDWRSIARRHLALFEDLIEGAQHKAATGGRASAV